MKLLSYQTETQFGSLTRTGALGKHGQVFDLNQACRLWLCNERGVSAGGAARLADALCPTQMLSLIEGGEVVLDSARAALDWAEGRGGLSPVSPDRMRWLAPVPNPPLLRDFMAFEEHLKNIYPRLGREIPPAWYEFPTYYKGNPGTLGAHGDDVAIPDYCQAFDLEFEFAAIIGKPGRDICEQDATDHIFGYTIYNDFSARDFQSREMSIGLGPAKGKDFDRGHVLGPYVVTRDEIPDPYALGMRAEINGKEWSVNNTSTMHWRFEQMIAHASRAETLMIGEVFGSGTVGGGSAAEFGKTLNRGSTVTLSIDGLGILQNRVT